MSSIENQNSLERENLINKIIELLKEKLEYYEERKRFFEEDKYYELEKDIISTANQKNKKPLSQYQPHKLFLFTVLRMNKDVTFTYKDCEKLLKPYYRIIDSWTFKDKYDIFDKLEKHYNESEKLSQDELKKILVDDLKLPIELLKYDLSNVFSTLLILLDFQNDYQKIENNTYTKPNITAINLGNKSFPLNIPNKLNNKEFLIDNLYRQSNLKAIIDFFETASKEEQEKERLTYEDDKTTISILKTMISKEYLKNLTDISDEFYYYVENNEDIVDLLYDLIGDNIIIKYSKKCDEADELEKILYSSDLVSYLYDNNIDPKSIPNIEVYEKKDNIIEILEFLKSLGINPGTSLLSYNKVIDILTTESIKTLSPLLNNHFISLKTLLNQYDYINNNLDEIKAKEEVLSKYIRFDDIFYNESIVFESLEEIKRRISIINQYNIVTNNKHIAIYLLCNIKYLDILDLVIEHNIPIYLFISICNTYNPLLTIKKIILCNRINEPYLKGNQLNYNIVTPNKFYIPDNMIDTYLSNASSLYKVDTNGLIDPTIEDYPEVKSLSDELIIDGDTYTNGEVYISKPKFLRKYSSVKDSTRLIQCLLSDTILTNDEINKLKYDLLNINTLKK